MMNRTLSGILFAAVATCSFAQTVTGTYSGTLSVDASKLPPVKDQQEKEKRDKGLATLKKVRLLLTLQKDGSYQTTISGASSESKGQSKPMTNEGTWVQKSGEVVLTATKSNGKPITTKAKDQVLKVVDGGKTLTGAFGSLQIVFKKSS